IRGRQVQGPVEQRVAEVRAFKIDADLQAGRADAVIVRVIDVEHQVERPARQADPGDADLLQRDGRFGEREAADRRARETQQHEKRVTGKGKRTLSSHHVSRFSFPASRAIRSFSLCQNSIRSPMVFSYPNSLGSYHLAPRNTSGR